MAANSNYIPPSEVLNQTHKPVAEEETQADGRKCAEDEKDFDEDDGEEGGGNSVAVEMSQLVVRVRRDSGDSLGSEISQSPPSSPRSRDQDW